MRPKAEWAILTQRLCQQGVTVYKARLIFHTSSKLAYFLNLNGKTVSDKEIVKYAAEAHFHQPKAAGSLL